MTRMVSSAKNNFIQELLLDIDLGRIQPLTSVKNIEGVISEFVEEYDDYAKLVDDLEEWHYIRQR